MLKNYYNKHIGEPCLLVGCGFSMTDKLAQEIMDKNVLSIGVNECYRFNDNAFYPKYHIHTDYETDFMLMNMDMFIEMEKHGTKIVFPDKTKQKLIDQIVDPLMFGLSNGNAFLVNKEGEKVWFNKGFTALFAAIQLAVFMGCNPIMLIGVDMTTKRKKLHPYDTSAMRVKQADRWDRIAFPCKRAHFRQEVVPALDRLGKTVFNLSKKSKLECFVKPDISTEEAMKWLSRPRYNSTSRQRAEQQPVIQA